MNEEQKQELRELIGDKRIHDGEVLVCVAVGYQFYVKVGGEVEEAHVYVDIKPSFFRSLAIPLNKWLALPKGAHVSFGKATSTPSR